MKFEENKEIFCVLIAEDNKNLLHLINNTIVKNGFITITCNSGIQALEQIFLQQPDIILLDYKLPDIDGREIIKKLMDKNIKIPFVIMTGHGDERIAVELMKLGARDYLVKDVNFIEFLPNVLHRISKEIAIDKAYNLAKAKLHETEERYKHLFINANDILYTMDLEGNFTTINPIAEAIFGISPSELIGLNITKFATPNSQKVALYNMHKQIVDRVSHLNFEIEIINKKNETHYLEINSYLRYISGNPFEVYGIARETTTRKKYEDILRKSEDKYRSIFENSGIGIFQTNHRGAFLTANNALALMLGYENSDKLINSIQNVNRIIHGTEQEKNDFLKLLLTTNDVIKYEQQLKRRDGIIITSNITARTVKNGEKIEYVEGFVEDITDSKRAKNAMKESIAQLKDAQKIAKIASFEEDLILKKFKFTDAFLEIIGYNEIENFSFEKFTELMLPEDRTAFNDLMNEIFSNNIQSSSIQFRILSPNQKLKYINAVIMLHFDDDDHPFKLMGTIQDVTEQKQQEELKKNLELTEKTSKIKQQLLTNLGHEMRTPMNGILGMVDVLLKTELSENQAEIATTVKDSSQQLMKLINNILDLLKIDSGKMMLYEEVFEFKNVQKSIKGLFKASAAHKNLCFEVIVDNKVPPIIKTDKIRLIQILTNLISNAIKFTEKGKIQITFSALKHWHDEVEIKVEINDSGIGIDPETLAVIFDKFTQGDASISRKYDGVGLGLSISKELVELLGGKIGVSSQLNKGSNFWFTFKANVCEQLPEII